MITNKRSINNPLKKIIQSELILTQTSPIHSKDSSRKLILKEEFKKYIPHSKFNRLNEEKTLDIVEIANILSKPAWYVFTLMKREYDFKTNIAKLDSITLTKNDKARIAKYYSQLYSIGLVKRISHQTYMINPSILMPTSDPEKLESLVDFWKQIP